MKKIVISLGGNALQPFKDSHTAAEQLAACFKTAKTVRSLANEGYQIALVHGNGPQVGKVVANYELANQIDPARNPLLPFDVCGSFTQGYIGYHLQNAIGCELRNSNIPTRNVVSLITQIVVDSRDEAFQNPTKPIGEFYTKQEAEKLHRLYNHTMIEDSGRGFRRVIASPLPREIIEKNIIKDLYSNGCIVISCGGGGIPVVYNSHGQYKGVEAVIDKDFSAALLAETIDADILLILTTVERVFINYNKINQQEISSMTIKEAKKHIKEGQFAPGSMLPKIEAALKFLERKPKAKLLITSIDKALDALAGRTGTLIKSNN